MSQKNIGISQLEKQLRHVSRKVHLLENSIAPSTLTLDDLISARGYTSKEWPPKKFFGNINLRLLFDSLTSYYFRRFLGDALNMGTVNKEKMALLVSKWGKECPNFVEKIIEIGIAKESRRGFKMTLNVNDFGVIFEWFIAQFLKKEMSLETAFEVHLKNLKDGGDIDVLARDKLDLIMIECKESPPNNVPVSELKTILARVEKIDPDAFILIIDTTLSIQRNILDNIKWISHAVPIRLREGVYQFDANNFIVTAKRDLLRNISYVISTARKH